MSELRNRLQCEGLLISREQDFPQVFIFDLNQSGDLYVKGDPEIVLRVVKTARSIAKYEGYGEHNAMLKLVVSRGELTKAKKTIFWHRRYHLSNPQSETLVSLEEWLKESGYPYVRIE